MNARFELFASWVCDLLDRTEALWSWEAFVDRCYVEPKSEPTDTGDAASGSAASS
jgi:hypothetical protein